MGCGHYSRSGWKRSVAKIKNATRTRANYFFVGAGDAAGAVAGAAAGAVEPVGAAEPEPVGAVEPAGDVEPAGECCGAGVGVAAGAAGCDCNTEREPVNTPRPSINAISMNAAAAPIVILAIKLAVPRGPKAVFEKSAPASALPGCSRITTIRITHERMNSP